MMLDTNKNYSHYPLPNPAQAPAQAPAQGAAPAAAQGGD